MHEYQKFPPIDLLKMVLNVKPSAALLYIKLWENKAKSAKIIIRRNDIQRHYGISRTLFKNNVYALGDMKLMRVNETQETYNLELYAG